MSRNREHDDLGSSLGESRMQGRFGIISGWINSTISPFLLQTRRLYVIRQACFGVLCDRLAYIDFAGKNLVRLPDN